MSKRFPGRRPSPLRIVALFLAIGALTAAGASGFRTFEDTSRAADDGRSWFAGYVDATVTPSLRFELPPNRASRNVVLSFVVADASRRCTPTWGGAYSLDRASSELDLDRRIARLRQSRGSIVVSFGGQRNDELAVACTDPAQLEQAYVQVIERYDVRTIDLDIEGAGLEDAAASRRRGEVLAKIQRQRANEGRPLAVWLTLPVATTGLTVTGTDAVSATLTSGLKLAGVNLMTMNFVESRQPGQSMADASIAGLEAAHRQLMILNRRAGNDLGPATTWKRMGATPMLGQNDLPREVFSLADARALNAFAAERGLGRMSVWSLNRDRACGDNYTDVTTVSTSCSGVTQGNESFATILGRTLAGRPDRAGTEPTVDEAPTTTVEDDPATSPYAIWTETNAYLPKTKIVWRRNVYVAKWWTRGDLPDDPVLQQHETPWTLIGPVLPGEKPIVAPKIASYAYPRWTASAVYTRGDRVLADGVAYEAKWWTQRDHPAAGSAAGVDPGALPWARLTDDQVRRANAARAARAQR